MTVTNPSRIDRLTPLYDPVETALCLIMVVVEKEVHPMFTGPPTPVSIK
jgi:hypothetical protein